LSCDRGKIETKDIWVALRQLTGHKQEPGVIDGVNAEALHTTQLRMYLNRSKPCYTVLQTPRSAFLQLVSM